METLLLTKGEAANALRITVRSIEWLIRQGRLASVKLGKRRLVPRAAVEKLAETGCGQIVPSPQPKNYARGRDGR